MDFLEELNAEQKKAAMQIEGSVMIIAGAGSGKTRVLTYRIANMIREGIDPFNIMALTFTNKAAKEMKTRVGKLIGYQESRNLWMGTFHSVFARILRAEHERIGYPANFTIYDTQDSKNLIKKILKELVLDEKKYKPGVVLSRISNAKNNLISAKAYANNSVIVNEDKQRSLPEMANLYKKYSEECFKNGAMDFDDLLFKTNVLFRDFSDLLYTYQHKFKYILVDEFQDTNFSQYNIIKKLSAAYQNVCVVGDDAQSIYGFRGANIQNILNFKKDYPETTTFKLEQNYRSTKNIVGAANSVIKKNKEQLEKKVWTDNGIGDKIEVFQCKSDNSEGGLVAQLINKQVNKVNADYNKFVVLYRTNMQSRAIEEALRKKNMPYKIYGGTSFYQRKEIKDVLAYLKLVINPMDNESFKRIINYPARGIGKTSLEKIHYLSSELNITLFEALKKITSSEVAVDINQGTIKKLLAFKKLIQHFSNQAYEMGAYDFLFELVQSSEILKTLYNDKTPEGTSRYENVKELLNGVKEFEEHEKAIRKIFIADYMEDVSLLTDADNEKSEDFNKVTLMTIHASKGLEFPYVYLIGLEENLFPSQQSLFSREDLEEERRLFYVALTRAEKKVTISYAQTRYKFGTPTFSEPSRFIEEVDEKHLKFNKLSINKSKVFDSFTNTKNTFNPYEKYAKINSNKVKKDVKQVTILPKNLKKVNSSDLTNQGFKVGMRVKHSKFGKGIIKELEEGKALVTFDQVGEKRLILKFAVLEII